MSGPVYDDPFGAMYGDGSRAQAPALEAEVRDPFNALLDSIAGEVVDLLARKNHDYGGSYVKLRDEFGPDSFLIRLGDKYNRLLALRGKQALIGESTDDTIRDIVGYCLLELAYRAEGARSEC